ncbi:RES family NAD+ phosphorylase [Rhodococcus globerulus]|uniref:RES family NAD+ phosphorylase n=1 Tax=Rhodococcus globerulus TaxID=33008 RepID=UPI003019F859
MSRDSVALGSPTRTLHLFPGRTLTTAQKLHRGHSTGNGPWWFASSGGGRFDLNPPRGTCYLAYDELTAIRETVGAPLANTGVITHAFSADRQLSTLTVPHDHRLADTCAEEAADFGLTRELASMTPYAIPQEWAAAFDATFTGIQYQTRFTTGAKPNAVGLFGEAGEAPWLVDPNPEPFTAAAQRNGFTIVRPPRTVRIIPPPVS